MSAAYQILGENRFKIIAYDRAADSIEQLTNEVKDLWDEKKLSDIPGVGQAIAKHLDELFRTGQVKHIDETLAKVPEAVYPLLLIPGIGPKKAYKLVQILSLDSAKTVISELQKAAHLHKIACIEGFGEKSEADILSGIDAYLRGQIKENRMVLSQADAIASELVSFLLSGGSIRAVDILGSLRRKVATIGDIDIAVATDEPEKVIDRFILFPHQKVIERGPTGASLLLHNGRQVDLRVQELASYGAMLQYFTGSKNHNIALRTYALEKGLSLNEYGIKNLKSGKVTPYSSEISFYNALGLPYIVPELRENRGEVEKAAFGKLPQLIEYDQVRGDLHLHTSFDIEPSHDLGVSSLDDYVKKAQQKGYEYIGIADHNPSISGHSVGDIVSIMKKRKKYYEQIMSTKHSKSNKITRVFIMCEIDILANGDLALPSEAFEYIDAAIVSIHSAFSQDRETMTKRILRGLSSHTKVRIFGHPTGRLLGSRESIDAHWDEIFSYCAQNNIAMEINASPTRLDLSDQMVFDAIKKGVKFSINSDSHGIDHMDMMQYGIAVARRGWATVHDIVNTQSYNAFSTWLLGGNNPT